MNDVTCIMLYYGRKSLAEEAMESFLRQTYPHKKLLIVNTHRDDVRFEKDYPNVEVHNVSSLTFDNLNEKYNYALSQVKTQWWAPWDSDDIWLPWHLENLVGVASQTTRNGMPRKIGKSRSYFMFGKNRDIKIGWNMWATSIWETFDKGRVYAQCDPSIVRNCDRQILYLDWDRHWIDMGGPKTPISYIFRWHVEKSHHSSAVLGADGLARSQKLRDDMNKKSLPNPWKPHWEVDYVKLVEGKHEAFNGL